MHRSPLALAAWVLLAACGREGPSATAPAAPRQVTVVAGIVSAKVSWLAPESDGGFPITSETVRSFPAYVTTGVKGLAAEVTGLQAGVRYSFTVSPSNIAGTGPASAQSAAMVPFGLPGVPSNVVAVPGVGRAAVSWAAPSDNGSPITGDTVAIAPAAPSASIAVSGTSAAATGLANGTAYRFV